MNRCPQRLPPASELCGGRELITPDMERAQCEKPAGHPWPHTVGAVYWTGEEDLSWAGRVQDLTSGT